MTVAGIVAEYNPFHLGHAFHLARTRERLGLDSAAVCVMNGPLGPAGGLCRGGQVDPGRAALAGGADLVLELPTPGHGLGGTLAGARWVCWLPRGWWMYCPSAARTGTCPLSRLPPPRWTPPTILKS